MTSHSSSPAGHYAKSSVYSFAGVERGQPGPSREERLQQQSLRGCHERGERKWVTRAVQVEQGEASGVVRLVTVQPGWVGQVRQDRWWAKVMRIMPKVRGTQRWAVMSTKEG